MSVKLHTWLTCAAFTVLASGCLNNPGTDPPAGELNFPVAMALSPGDAPPSRLFVVNSNFDLRFNAGSIMSLDLACLDQLITACGGGECVLSLDQGACSLVRSEVWVASHSAGLAVSPDGRRLYAPMRSENDLTFIDVDTDGGLSCGGSGDPPRCDDAHREVTRPEGLVAPTDPVGLVVGDLATISMGLSGTYVLQAHRQGSASLILDQSGGDGPELVDIVQGSQASVIGLTQRPGTDEVWMTSSRGAGIGLLNLAWPESEDALDNPILFNGGGIQVTGVDIGSAAGADVRAVRFDPGPDAARVYALSRRPEALLIADIDSPLRGALDISRVVEVGNGPSRLEIVELRGRLFAFVSCFDSRDLYVVDVERGALVGVVRGMSGPFELQVDADRERIYVADFRSSVIRVVGLSPLLSCLDSGPGAAGSCAPEVVATVGEPRPVMELQ